MDRFSLTQPMRTCKTGKSKEDRYVEHDPRLLYAAVEGLKPVEIEKEYKQAVARTEAENERLLKENADLRAKLARMEDRLSAQLEQILSGMNLR